MYELSTNIYEEIKLPRTHIPIREPKEPVINAGYQQPYAWTAPEIVVSVYFQFRNSLQVNL